MNGWEFLDKLLDRFPGWPTERQWVIGALVGTLWFMLNMAINNPKLWDVKLFEILIQGFALTGFLSMVLAFYFAANKASETKSDNTAKAFDAIKAAAESSPAQPVAANAAKEVAEAAQEKSEEFQSPRPVDYHHYKDDV